MAFLLDDILLALVKGVWFIAKKIHNQAIDEVLDKEGVRRQLRQLYISFETGELTEEEFQVREEALVQCLEQIEAYEKTRTA